MSPTLSTTLRLPTELTRRDFTAHMFSNMVALYPSIRYSPTRFFLAHYRLASALAFAFALAACSGGGSGGAGTTVDNTDIASWRTRDAKPLMSMVTGSGAGWPFDNRLWQSSSRTLGELPSWGAVRLGTAAREGIVVGAWGISQNVQASVPPMRMVIFEQGADGLMREATAAFVDSDMTDGVGKILVSDLNVDGRDDFVFTQYTETPTSVNPPSPLPLGMAFVASNSGRFLRFDLGPDLFYAGADLVTINGLPQLFIASGGYSLESATWTGAPTWRWNGAGFSKTFIGPTDPSSWYNSGDTVVRDFTGNGDLWVVRTNNDRGPGLASNAPMLTRAWRINGSQFDTTPVAIAKAYFDDKPAYANTESWLDPKSKTDNGRMQAIDINQDGKLDLVLFGCIWSPAKQTQGTIMQLLVNRGAMAFEDVTDSWNPEYRRDALLVGDPHVSDIDGSGIESLLLFHGAWLSIGSSYYPRSRHGSYILVNDGTGRFYAAMDSEFTNLGAQVLDYVRAQGLRADNLTQPNFMAYRRPDGKLNFLASLMSGRVGILDPGSDQTAYVNVPLGIDITTGFKRDLTVATRNGSRNIRTFAGNDTVFRALNDPDCRIDGGLGTNTVVYPGKKADWVLAKAGDGSITISPVAGSGTDTLKRIQKARFDDQTVDLTGL